MIACLGAGRMGRGIAVTFAYAGTNVALLDLKPRPPEAFATLAAEARAEIHSTIASLAAIGLFDPAHIDTIAARVAIHPAEAAPSILAAAEIVFEGVPEIPALKRDILAEASRHAPPETIIASTTSTILVDDISSAVLHPERFLNAHFLNPAYLIPLVEISPGAATSQSTIARLTAALEAIGKKPIICAASPGYIVPRIQALAMNEAARMVAEGVATAENLDAAIRYGFGPRFAVLGLLEFIDWGGGDILHHASRYLADTLHNSRYEAPPIIAENMAANRLGLRSGTGFYDWSGQDLAAYRQSRLARFADVLRNLGLVRGPVV